MNIKNRTLSEDLLCQLVWFYSPHIFQRTRGVSEWWGRFFLLSPSSLPSRTAHTRNSSVRTPYQVHWYESESGRRSDDGDDEIDLWWWGVFELSPSLWDPFRERETKSWKEGGRSRTWRQIAGTWINGKPRRYNTFRFMVCPNEVQWTTSWARLDIVSFFFFFFVSEWINSMRK